MEGESKVLMRAGLGPKRRGEEFYHGTAGRGWEGTGERDGTIYVEDTKEGTGKDLYTEDTEEHGRKRREGKRKAEGGRLATEGEKKGEVD